MEAKRSVTTAQSVRTDRKADLTPDREEVLYGVIGAALAERLSRGKTLKGRKIA